MNNFCEDSLWDWDLTWNLNNRSASIENYYGPDLTNCFEKTILVWIPCGFLWLSSPFEICLSWSRNRICPIIKTPTNGPLTAATQIPSNPIIPWTLLNVSKCILIVVLLIFQSLQLADVLIPTSNKNIARSSYAVEWVAPIIWILTLLLALFLVIHGRLKGIRSSGIQFIFWTLMVLCGIFPLRTAILKWSHQDHDDGEETIDDDDDWYFENVTTIIMYPLILGQLILNCKADGGGKRHKKDGGSFSSVHKHENPEETSSFPSRLLFIWFDRLLWKGYKKPLRFEDLWELSAENKCRNYIEEFDAHFEKTKGKNKKVRGRRGDDKSPTNILPALIRIFGPSILVGTCLKFFQDCLLFVAPQILTLLVSFLENREEVWKGALYAIVLLLTTLLQTILLGQYFHRMYRLGIRCRNTLASAIYRKSLVMSNAAKKNSTLGELVNLMSVDASHFMELIPYLNMLWSAPFQICMSLYFLWRIIGWSMLSGLAVLLIIVPANSLMSSRLKVLQSKQMKIKDLRVKSMNEEFSGIKVLKLYAWEALCEQHINCIRDKEMEILKSIAWMESMISFLLHCAPFLVALVSSGTYVLIDETHIFDATTAFVSLTLFNIMAVPIIMLPKVISNVVKAQVSLKRLNKFLDTPEIGHNDVTHLQSFDAINIENSTFAWDEDLITLRNINLRVKKGSLVAIVGPVGCGKTSLLSAILGELPRTTTNGVVNTDGSIAYVAQQAWILSGSLQDNILFGTTTKDLAKYDRVLEACALLPDLAILPAGDKTEIGERGINLSGGQKQRVALARAAYNTADIYLLDDPFSALDSQVGKHIFEQLVGPDGLLKGKARVVVTHGLAHLPLVDQIIVMKDGEILEIGTYDQLIAKKGDFSEFLSIHNNTTANNYTNGKLDYTNEDLIIVDDHYIENNDALEVANRARKFSRSLSSKSHNRNSATRKSSIVSSQFAIMMNEDVLASVSPDDEESSSSSSLIKSEKTEVGSVKIGVYLYYMKSIGVLFVLLTMLLQSTSQGFSILTNIWLAEWSSQPIINGTQNSSQRMMYLCVYASLGLGHVIFLVFGSISMALGMSKSSNILHSQMLARIYRAPLSFFDSTPIGRLVNRFGKDIDTIDTVLPLDFRDFLNCMFNVLSTLIVICYSIPIFFTIILPLGLVHYFVQRYYISTSRQLKRMESVSRSPIYSHFSETLSGLSTIRAFGLQGRFTSEFESKVDYNQTVYFPFVVSNRWLSIRLETIANVIVFCASLFAVLQADELSSGLVGLCVSYALQVTNTLNWVVRMTAAVETNIVAVERIKEYCEIPQEAEFHNEKTKPNETWPELGEIIFTDYQTRYRPGLDLVLNHINCKIEAGEKIGIVGRTGAGKSSLTLALFRMIEPSGGSIIIDGVNIAKLGLYDLRSKLTIIPQDPVLYSGPLRLNIDPFGQHSDDAIWKVLELANLKHFVKGLPFGLEYEISEGGENLSIGQRQQICLARALLRKTKILILDEATASVDLETDNFIQQTIRAEFTNATVLTIAHRLKTIMDSSRVMVLDNGKIQEFDTPANLLLNKYSLFYAMAKDSGLV